MLDDLPESWLRDVGDELDQPYFHHLAGFVDEERRNSTVYPPEADVFNALKLTPYEQSACRLARPEPLA